VTALMLVELPLHPLSGQVAGFKKQDSPFLLAVGYLETRTNIGQASLIASIALSVLAVAAAVVAKWPRTATIALAVGLNLAWLTALYAGSMAAGARAHVIRQTFPAHLDWVDRTGLRNVQYVRTRGSGQIDIFNTLFWNPKSTDRILLLGDHAASPDVVPVPYITVRSDGALTLAGKPIRTPLLVEREAVRVVLAGVRTVERSGPQGDLLLVVPAPEARLVLLGEGISSGNLASALASIEVWPAPRDRVVRFNLVLPSSVGLRLQKVSIQAGTWSRDLQLPAGKVVPVAVPIPANTHVKVQLHAKIVIGANGRFLCCELTGLQLVRAG
jgi:hypothetical protein